MTPAARGVRRTSDEITRDILDIAAGLIARRGIKDTAVQAVADQAGYSKAAILSRFTSKERLVQAALEQCIELTEAIRGTTESASPGSERDAVALVGLVDLALSSPGWAELVVAALALRWGEAVTDEGERMAGALLAMFDISIADAAATTLDRRARVTGALGALVVLSLTYMTEASAEQARPYLLHTAWNALGHGGGFPRA